MLKKPGSYTDRANAALGSLQRSANAMGMLRSRIEARINPEKSVAGDPDLNRTLELVKRAQLLLKEISAKAESARFLEEFIRIINGASASVEEIQGEVQELVPMAEAALAQMHDTISNVSVALAPAKEDIDPSIIAHAAESAALEHQNVLASEGKVSAKLPGTESAPAEKEEQLEQVAI